MVPIMENVLPKKETYYGYKVHALITLEGYIASFEITPASTDDREGLRDLADHWSMSLILIPSFLYTEIFFKVSTSCAV